MTGLLRIIGFSWMALLLGGCSELEGEQPLFDGVDYPVSLGILSGGNHLLVANSNYDLGRRFASVAVVDLATRSFLPESGVSVGAFPGVMVTGAPDDEGDSRALYLPVREDDSLTWASIRWKDGAPVLDCDDPDESYGDRRCGGRFVVVEGVDVSDGEDESTEVGNDPFASLVLPGRAGEPDHLLVGSLRDGSVDLFTLSSSDGAPELVDRLVVTQGINDLAAHPSRTVFASAKYSASVLRVRVRTEAGRSTLEGLPPIALPLATTSSDIGRSLAFTGDGRRLLVAWRAPDGLMVLDTSGEGSTDGEIRFLGLVSLADDPSCVRIYPTAPGGEDRAWVTSLGNNSVYVVDPETLLVEARIRLGPSNVTPGFHGIAPFSLAWSPARREVYAAGFLGHAVSVIDADPDSASFHTVIEEIR